MAKNKQKKIAGLTYDEWLKKPGRKPAKPVRREEVKKYSNKIIAFVDVLGIKTLIEQHRNNDEYKAIDKIEKMRKIHTFKPEGYPPLFKNVKIMRDGEVFDLN